MSTQPADAKTGQLQPRPPHGSRARRLSLWLGGLLLAYLLLAYPVAPQVWRTAIKHHPNLSTAPRVTHTANGIAGDPVNVALVGSETNVLLAMKATGWFPADPLTLRSSLRIAVDSVLRHPDEDAPVSSLFLFGRRQDLAFEQEVGNSPRQRHHVRFWRWDHLENGREVWFGAATFDESVGLSHTTGQVTHHIGPDVDAERDRILDALRAAGRAQEIYWLIGFQKDSEGKNGGGDRWRTDRRLGVAILLEQPATSAPGK